MSFHVGQKVARIEGGLITRNVAIPAIGEPCTVANSYEFFGEQVIELAEYPVPADSKHPPGMYARYFRPIVERKTDISIFKKMLTPAPERVS